MTHLFCRRCNHLHACPPGCTSFTCQHCGWRLDDADCFCRWCLAERAPAAPVPVAPFVGPVAVAVSEGLARE